MKTISAREFNRDVSAAKRDATLGPVTITDRGEPAFVLVSIEHYRQRIAQNAESIVDRLSVDDDLDLEVEPARISLVVPEL